MTPNEVSAWVLYLAEQSIKKTTLVDKVEAIRSVIEWGRKASHRTLFPDGNPVDHVELPEREVRDSAKRTYTLEQAQRVLLAARQQNLSYRRWMPWVMAYSGMRVGEVVQLEAEDLVEFRGHWFLTVRDDGAARTTKTSKARIVPLHPDLVREGFVDFVLSVGAGRIFDGTRHQQNLGEWIRGQVLTGEKSTPAPNHGFRHLLDDLRLGVMGDDAYAIISGRALKTSSALYGKSREMWVRLAEEMNRLPSLIDELALTRSG